MWDSFWDVVWTTLLIFAFVAYLMILFAILVDLFWRDSKTSGWVKAVWMVLLIIIPYITALVYLIARGKGMAERARESHIREKQQTDSYIRETAGRSPAQEIAEARKLLDSGTITEAEFASLKAKALS
ncbi:SHOCT domain-containing protein [Nocardia australiensis]|uniref:SHOCT domain-containing protein n=1 Tax=Nocardia australiensis TaxID=2887191 RepID=UPI001D13D15F|nr:SHOCT domain-containing protein [Nocardia australiensis]